MAKEIRGLYKRADIYWFRYTSHKGQERISLETSDYDPTLLKALVDHPSESLPVEIKGWLDMNKPEHLAKIAKTLMALRNHNGGQRHFHETACLRSPQPPLCPFA